MLYARLRHAIANAAINEVNSAQGHNPGEGEKTTVYSFCSTIETM